MEDARQRKTRFWNGAVAAIVVLACAIFGLFLAVILVKGSLENLQNHRDVLFARVETCLATAANAITLAAAGHSETPETWGREFRPFARLLFAQNPCITAAARLTAGTPGQGGLRVIEAESAAGSPPFRPLPALAENWALPGNLGREREAEAGLVATPLFGPGEEADFLLYHRVTVIGKPPQLLVLRLDLSGFLDEVAHGAAHLQFRLAVAGAGQSETPTPLIELVEESGAIAAPFLPARRSGRQIQVGGVALDFDLEARPALRPGDAWLLAGLFLLLALGFAGLYVSHRRHQAALARLHHGERRFRDFADASSHWFWEMDDRLRFTYISPGISRVTGEDPADFIGKTRREIAGAIPANAEALRENLAAMERHEAFSDFIFSRPKVNGGQVHLALSGKPVFSAGGAFLGYRGTARDISDAVIARQALERAHGELEQRVAERTRELEQANRDLTQQIEERTRTEAALRSREDELRQVQRLRAVGQLTGGIAHDFNNLLAVISGNAEIIEDCDDGEKQKSVAAILHAAGRGAELTQLLLAFSRRQSLRPRTIDPVSLLEGMVDLLRRTLGETVGLQLKARADVWTVQVDSGQLESALLNLAINARDAMPQGGVLKIELENAQLDAGDVAALAEVSPGDYVRLSVIDTGAGMSPAVLEHAFEPFFTTKDVGEGSGLGLSMVYGFAKQSGGHVAISSAPSKGTTVQLYLPRARQFPEEAGTAPSPKLLRGRGETVLLLEDDPDLRQMTKVILEGLGYRVLPAADGRMAREVHARNGRIDLLLSDVVLPGGISGPQFAALARQSQPDLKVLFMSGYPHEKLRDGEALDAGVELISKPFRKNELATRVRGALDAG